MIRESLNAAYLLLSGVLIIALLVMFGILRPLIQDINGIHRSLMDARQTLREREAFLQQIDRKQVALEGQLMHERALEVALPTQEAIEDVTRLIHQASVTSGGTIFNLENESVKIQREATTRQGRGEASALVPGVRTHGVVVTFVGSYQQLRVFLEQLHQAPRLFEPVSLVIERKDSQVDAVVAKINLQFYRYDASKVSRAP